MGTAFFPKISSKSGLTLVEVMLIVGFLAIVFLPLLQMMSQEFVVSSESEATLKASALAEKTIEEEKNLSYGNIVNVPKTAIANFPGFSKEINVTEPNPNLKEVQVIIYYPVKGVELPFTLNTMIVNL